MDYFEGKEQKYLSNILIGFIFWRNDVAQQEKLKIDELISYLKGELRNSVIVGYYISEDECPTKIYERKKDENIQEKENKIEKEWSFWKSLKQRRYLNNLLKLFDRYK